MAVGLMSRVGPRAATAYIAVRPDFSPFDQQVNAERGKMKQRFAGLGKAAAAGLAVGVAVGGKAAVKAAVDLGEQINKTKVVFRGHEKTVLNWSKTTSTAIGTSRREALEAAGTFGNMLVPMGFARKEAAKWSVSLVNLAADLASFNNASPADTLEAVRAGLAGETEPLRKYGIFLNDARLKQEALNLGLKNSVGPNGALTANAKAQATYALILKDSADAQGDFHRTSSSLANQQRVLKAQVEDVGATVGKQLIPPLTEAAKFTSKFIHQMQTGKGPGGEFAGVVSDLAKGAKDAGETVGPVLLDIGKFAAKHDSVLKVAGGVTALALGLKGIKGAGKITGITDLLGIGKRGLGRGGLPGIASKAAPIPVFVTNMGGLPGGKPGTPGAPVPGPGGKAPKPRWTARLIRGAGWVLWPIAATEVASELAGNPQSGNIGPRGIPVVGGKTPGKAAGGVQFDARDAAREHEARVVAARDRALGIRSMGMEVELLKGRAAAGRHLVERLKSEGATTEQVTAAQKRARARTYELKVAEYELAKQTGASRERLEKLRSAIERLRSKRISVAVDINIPSLNVRAPGNLTGTGPQGPGARTGDSGPGGDGWGISRGITAKVRARVKASAKRDPMAYLMAAGGGDPGSGPGAFHAFDPIAGRFGLHLSSGYRPGAITSSGNASYHSMNRAGDYADGAPSMLNFARFMAAVFGSKLKELIHTPLGFSIKNGQQVAPYAAADHYDHVHVALQRGGLIPGQGNGDKVPVLAEPGEGFINKRAVSALGGSSAIDAINRMIPRFQKGGTVPKEYARLFRMAQGRFHVPANVLAGLTWIESKFNQGAVSGAGARGATQFMPGTAPTYGVQFGPGHHALATQIFGTAKYLNALGFQTDPRGALAKYNGGPGNPQYGYATDVLAAAAGYGALNDGSGGRGVHQPPLVWNGQQWVRRQHRQRVSTRLPRRGETRAHYRNHLLHTRQPDWWRRPGEARKHYRGRTTQKQRQRNQRWLRRQHKLPPSHHGLSPDAGNIFMGAFGDQIANRQALAALTPETTDDIQVLQDAVRGWQAWLEWAQGRHDQAAVTEAATNLKSARDALTDLTGAGTTTDLAQQQIDIGKEANALEARKVALLESQGPQLLAGLAMFSGDVLGRNAGRARGFPSFAGVGGLARA